MIGPAGRKGMPLKPLPLLQESKALQALYSNELVIYSREDFNEDVSDVWGKMVYSCGFVGFTVLIDFLAIRTR